ncbi:hypothetical protein Ddc_10059 [Ditylenchus destructor]|nr:hypothetical protein Ddc_10059 [Ditylenchus destructor]
MQIKPKGAYILKTYTPKHVLKKIGRTFKVDPKETEAAKKYLKSVVSQLNKVQSLFTKHIKPFVQSATKGHHEGGKHGSGKAAGPGKNDLDQIVSKAKSLLKKGKKVLSNCPCKRLGPHTKVDIEEKVKKAVVKAQTDLVAGVTHLFYFIANANCHAKKQNAPCDAKEVERAAESLPKDLQLPLASPEEIKKMNEKDGIRMPKHGEGKHGKANAETGAKKEHKHGHTHGKGNSGAAAEMGAKESHKHGHKHGHHGKGQFIKYVAEDEGQIMDKQNILCRSVKRRQADSPPNRNKRMLRKKVDIPDDTWLETLKFLTCPQWLQKCFVSRQINGIAQRNISRLPKVIVDSVDETRRLLYILFTLYQC